MAGGLTPDERCISARIALTWSCIAGAEPPAPAPGLYQIRCWQHGRLLFEDRIRLPDDGAAYGIRLSGTDRNGKPMYVAETRNATCLVRQAPPPSY